MLLGSSNLNSSRHPPWYSCCSWSHWHSPFPVSCFGSCSHCTPRWRISNNASSVTSWECLLSCTEFSSAQWPSLQYSSWFPPCRFPCVSPKVRHHFEWWKFHSADKLRRLRRQYMEGTLVAVGRLACSPLLRCVCIDRLSLATIREQQKIRCSFLCLAFLHLTFCFDIHAGDVR